MFVLLAGASAQLPFALVNMKLHTIRDATTRGAVCNDGSPATFYFRDCPRPSSECADWPSDWCASPATARPVEQCFTTPPRMRTQHTCPGSHLGIVMTRDLLLTFGFHLLLIVTYSLTADVPGCWSLTAATLLTPATTASRARRARPPRPGECRRDTSTPRFFHLEVHSLLTAYNAQLSIYCSLHRRGHKLSHDPATSLE